MNRFLRKRYTLLFFRVFGIFGDKDPFDWNLRVIFITRAAEFTYTVVFVDIAHRCNFCCV